MGKAQMAQFPPREGQFPWTTVELMRVWDEIVYPAPKYFRDRLFGGPAGAQITGADSMAVDYWFEDQLLAPYVSKISMGRVMRRSKYKTRQISPAKLAPIRITHPSDLYDKLPGEAVGGPDVETRDAELLKTDMSELDKMIARVEEQQCCSAICEGRIIQSVIEEGELLPIEQIEYETQPHVVVSPPWTDLTNSDPLADIKAGMKALSASAGAQCDFCCLGDQAADLLETNPKTKEAYNLLWFKQGELRPEEVEWQVTSIGSFRGISLMAYSAEYEHPLTGAMTPYIPPNYVVLAATMGGGGTMAYCGVWQESDDGNRHQLYANDRVWRIYFDQEVKHVRCISRPIPLIPNSRTFMILEVA
jgi:hypothetical protein